MKRTALNQKGSTHLAAILAVIVVVLAGVAGYRVLHAADTTPAASSTTASTHATAPDTFKNAADVRQADASLDSTTIGSQVNPDELDNDINSLL